MKTILFIGYSSSGKTTTLTTVARALRRRREKFATIKHIHHKDFTIDTPGKDTSLHAAAGASIIGVLAPRELTVIWKRDTTKMKLDFIIGMLRREKVGYILVEGLHRKLSSRRGVITVLCAASETDARSFLNSTQRKPVCIVGKFAKGRSGKSFYGVPLLELPKDISRFMSLVR
jgi:molybdopterin-guanine dinucleotide biosynthesis protein MobB